MGTLTVETLDQKAIRQAFPLLSIKALYSRGVDEITSTRGVSNKAFISGLLDRLPTPKEFFAYLFVPGYAARSAKGLGKAAPQDKVPGIPLGAYTTEAQEVLREALS